MTTNGWFAGIDPGDLEAATDRVREGEADAPADWPGLAVEAGFAGDEGEYYDLLREATLAATRGVVRERERADDVQLKRGVRAMDDADRVANELAERVTEWAGSLGLLEDVEPEDGVAAARAVAELDLEGTHERQVQSLARRTLDLATEATELRAYVERSAPAVAPNLSALAGPVLAARLVALAGDLESLARSTSGTVQVLGAEDALFAHLRGSAPSPKHGVIYTHEYVRNTAPDERGSAARALAGKLAIAARVDHYSGERKPELDRELDERIARIRARGGEDDE
jgi:nucleolar protein 56